jgi:hypothetical protein
MSILPIYVSKEFARDNGEYLLKAMKSVIGFTFLISIFASYKAILVGYRFQGVLCNANTYGITATFWITILLIRSKNIGLSNKDVLLAFLIFITIILSGSRSSVIASLLILLYTFSNNLKLITGFAFCIFLLVLSIDYFTSLDFIFSRFENLSNSAVESGRAEIWKNAFSYISLNYNGYGMDAPFLLLGTGNVHNCYIRFLLTMGFFFSIVTIFFYLRLLLILFFKKVEVLPRSLKAFMLAFALSNYAEDFFVGLGSSMLIYLAIIIGFISYFFIPIPNDNPKVNEYSFA